MVVSEYKGKKGHILSINKIFILFYFLFNNYRTVCAMSYKNIFGNCNSVFLQFEPSVVLTDFFHLL